MNNLESRPFVVSAAAFTDTGQVRKNNQDYVAYHTPAEGSGRDQYGALFLVCDGVGGHSDGEIASEYAGRRILNDYYQGPSDQPSSARLVAAIQQANTDIFEQNAGLPDARKMTTTVVAAALTNSSLHLAHAGDSRAYLVRAGHITQLTTDHSWVAEMLRLGDLTAEEAQHHPWRNRITRSLGMKEHVDVDEQSIDVALGDVVVLCSDGLTRHVADAEIAETVTRHAARVAAQRLVNLARERGGTDNISVIVIQLQNLRASGEGTVIPTQREGSGDQARRRVWLLLLIIAGALLLLIAGALIYTQTDLLRRQEPAPPTVAATARAPGPTLAATATTDFPAAAPVNTGTPTPVSPTPDPTSTIRPTSTSAPAGAATQAPMVSGTPPTEEPGATTAETGGATGVASPARTLTALASRVPTLPPTGTPKPSLLATDEPTIMPTGIQTGIPTLKPTS